MTPMDDGRLCTVDLQGLLRLKPCPHCRRKVRLSQKTARQRRQSHFSATVGTRLKTSTNVTMMIVLGIHAHLPWARCSQAKAIGLNSLPHSPT